MLPFHILDFFFVAYIAVWILLGMVILREVRTQPGIVKLMAILAIILGPLGMFAYLAVRYLGQSLRDGYMLLQSRDRWLHDG